MTASAEARDTALLAAQAAADKLATDVSIVDVSDRLAITDAFVLASAPNERQVQSIVDAVEERLRRARHQAGPPRGRRRGPLGAARLHRRRGARAARRGARLLRPRAAVEGLPDHPVRRPGPPAVPTGHRRRTTARSAQPIRDTGPTRRRPAGDLRAPGARRCRGWCSGGTAGPSGTPPGASRASWTRRWTRRAGARPRVAAPHLVAAGLPRRVDDRGGRPATSAARPRPRRRSPPCSACRCALDAAAARARHGLWEGLTRDEVAERYPDQFADWMAGRPVRGRGGEEPGRRRRPGARPRWPTCRRRRSAVVVTHGGTAGRLWSGCSGSAPTTAASSGRWATAPGASSPYQGARWRLMRHNASALPGAGRGGRGPPATPLPPCPARRGRRADDAAPTTDADAVL